MSSSTKDFPAKRIIDMPVHPTANTFPWMTDEEFSGLKRSVKDKGVLVPFKYWRDEKGQEYLVDGRNRIKSVRELINDGSVNESVELPCEEFKGTEREVIDFIISINLDRRNLTSSQKAALTVKGLSQYYKAGKKSMVRIVEDGDAAAKLAEKTGTNRTYIFNANTLFFEAPEILDEVISGSLNMMAAMKKLEKAKESERRPRRKAEEKDSGDGDHKDDSKADDKKEEKTIPVENEGAEVKTKTVFYDGLKNEVPQELNSIFAGRDDFQEVIKSLRAVYKEIQGIGSQDFGKFLDVEMALAPISNVIGQLKNEQPHCPCPECSPGGGKKKCELCRGVRFLPKLIFEAYLKTKS